MSKLLEGAILIGVVVMAILLVIAIFMNLELFLTLAILLVLLALVVVVVLGLIGLIAAVPFYLLKGGREPEPRSYNIDEIRPIKEEEKK
ncbi:MAG: hypothetical protein QW520_00715 [Methanomassiliicoccales archaeon]